MRIAISGSHRTGKSTLLAELAELLPNYTTVEEPYHLLEEEGHEFAHPPSLEDFEAQLERSIEELLDADAETLFDRCPLDVLAYIAVHDADGFDVEAWMPEVRKAVDKLDLVVFVPIEERDRIAFSDSDDEADTRAAVDEKLRELLIDDLQDFGLEVLEVRGNLDSRVRAVMRSVRRGAA
jgi:predicted ATPase